MFSHIQFNRDFIEIPTRNIEGMRYYEMNGILYPSITTILSIKNFKRLLAWRKKVGIEQAKRESIRTSKRGKTFHTVCENYLKNKDISCYKNEIMPYYLFKQIKKELDRIDNIYKIEPTLYSEKYKIAGRADCIAEFDDVLSIIDFKSANKMRSSDILEIHSIQETAYSIMWQELTGISVEQIVTIIACEDGSIHTQIDRPNYFFNKLKNAISEFTVYERSKCSRN